MRFLTRFLSNGYKVAAKHVRGNIVDVGGRLVRARSRSYGDAQRIKSETGMADFEAALGAVAAKAEATGKFNDRALEILLRPHISKVDAFNDGVLLAAFEARDGKGALTRDWLHSLPELAVRTLRWEAMKCNPGMVDQVTELSEAIGERFKIDDRLLLRHIITETLAGRAQHRFLGGPQEASSSG